MRYRIRADTERCSTRRDRDYERLLYGRLALDISRSKQLVDSAYVAEAAIYGSQRRIVG